MKRTLDRRIEFDTKSRAFNVSNVLPTREFRNYTWPCYDFLDQGTEGACVGFSLAHELSAIPLRVASASAELALQIYRRARMLDIWPGEDYDGTSVLAGFKAVQELRGVEGAPLIGEYRWSFGLEDGVRAIGSLGPAILGINWYSDMFDTNYKGYVVKGGYVAGGHAIMARGVSCKFIHKGNKTEWDNVDKYASYVTLHNSWGKSWGRYGLAKISFLDLEALLYEQGEMCIPMKRTK